MRILAGALLLFLLGQDQKLPLPGPAEQKKAEDEIRAVFKAEFALKTRDARRNLARKLLTEAADEKNSPTSRYVVLLLGRDLAVEALDLATVFAAIDTLEKQYDVAKPALAGAAFVSNANALKVSALLAAQKFSASPEDAALLGDAYLKIAEDTLKEKLFDDALAAAQAAERFAKSAKASSILERAAPLVKGIPELKKEDEQFGAAITTKADDPAAKLTKGRYLLFAVGDEKAGIENLLGCSDEGLKNVAKLEVASPATGDLQAELAEAWLALSAKESNVLHKNRYQQRARHWFTEALKNAGGILRAKLEKRLAETGKSESPLTPASGGIDLMRLLSSKDGVQGEWTLTGAELNTPKQATHCRIQIPYAPGENEYDLVVVAQSRDTETNLAIGMAYGKIQFSVELDGMAKNDTSGMHLLDSKVFSVNETARKGRVFTSNQSHTILCSVRRDGVTVSVNGKKVTEYKGPYTRLSLHKDWKMPSQESLFLAAWNSRWSVTQLTLKQITGQGKVLR